MPVLAVDHHPADHSWDVTDPLRDLLARRVLEGAYPDREGTDHQDEAEGREEAETQAEAEAQDEDGTGRP